MPIASSYDLWTGPERCLGGAVGLLPMIDEAQLLSYFCAALAAAGNAVGNVMQRKASLDEPGERPFGLAFLRDLTAAPSVLGSHYVVVTMTADQAALDADEPFTLIIIDYAQGFAPVIAALRAAAPHTALLIVSRPGGPQPPSDSAPHQLTTTAQLRSAVGQILASAWPG